MSATWVGTCLGLEADDLHDFDESSRPVTYRTFLRHVGRETVRELDERFGFPLRKDWHVSFAVGKWRGQRAVCLFHSRIHYIWTLA